MGVLLLGTVLAAILIAHGRLAVQTRKAQARIEACRVLEDLMDVWWSDPSTFPRQGRGTPADAAGWRWQAHRINRPAVQAMGAEVVRVEVFQSRLSQTDAAASVEVMLPIESSQEKNTQE